MPIDTVALVGVLEDLVGEPLDTDQIEAWLESTEDAVNDPFVSSRLGPTYKVAIGDDGAFSIAGLPAGGIFRLWVRYLPRYGSTTREWHSNWVQLLDDADLSDPALEAITPTSIESAASPFVTGTTVANRRGLAPWLAALANRDNAPAKIMTITDSTFHYGAASWAQTTSERLRALLQAKYPTTGVAVPGAGYVPAYKFLSPTLPGVFSGGTGYTTGAGLGMEHYNLHNPGTAQYRELAIDGDGVRIWYGKSNYLVHQGIVSIDGVDQAALSSANGIAYPPQVDSDGHYQDYSFAAGAHTIRVRGVSSLAFILDGIEVFNGDKTKGIHVYPGGRSGGKASQYAGAAGDRHWEIAAVIQPQLWVLALGINDELDGDAAAYLADLDTILDTRIPAAMGSNPYSVLLVGQYRPSRAVDTALWTAMQSGLKARAAGNVAMLDVGALWPLPLEADGSTSYGLMSEGTNPLHPSTLGHELQAQVVADAIGFI